MKELIGKTIANVYTDAGRQYLQFACTDGTVTTYITDGDCCSRSWIEHTSGADGLRGATVVGVAYNDDWNEPAREFWEGGAEDCGDFMDRKAGTVTFGVADE